MRPKLIAKSGTYRLGLLIKIQMNKSVITAILLLIFFAGNFREARGQGIRNMDDRIFMEMQGWRNPANEQFYTTLSGSAGPVSAGIPLMLGCVSLYKKDSLLLRKSLLTGAAAIFAFGLAQAIKPLVARPRPVEYFTWLEVASPKPSGWSMPSGTTSTAFATATALSLEFPQWQVILPSFLWAGSVGVSRIVLGHHYPGDVLCGAALGAGCAWLTHAIQKKLLCRKKPSGSLRQT